MLPLFPSGLHLREAVVIVIDTRPLITGWQKHACTQNNLSYKHIRSNIHTAASNLPRHNMQLTRVGPLFYLHFVTKCHNTPRLVFHWKWHFCCVDGIVFVWLVYNDSCLPYDPCHPPHRLQAWQASYRLRTPFIWVYVTSLSQEVSSFPVWRCLLRCNNYALTRHIEFDTIMMKCMLIQLKHGYPITLPNTTIGSNIILSLQTSIILSILFVIYLNYPPCVQCL